MLVVLPDGTNYENGEMPSAEMVEKMTRFNEELAKAGVLLALDGLHPTSKGARIAHKQGKPIVTDGPFAEGREVVGGYWIIKTDSYEEALDWAKKAPMNDEIIELRRVFDIEDFPQDVQEAADSAIVREQLSGRGI